MSLTLLLDLDDTLLGNDMGAFLPAYLKALAGHMAPYANPNEFVSTILSATGEMIANSRPDRSLKETFDAAFYPSLGLEAQDVKEAINGFYRQVFPSLRKLTRPVPEAVELVEAALARGYRIAIATNPLFPLVAIHERLAWAGMPTDKYPFSLVASCETFHFSKPNPAYYAEILALLGWPDGPVLMVGDDLDNDIIPARNLGLATFWIAPESAGIVDGNQAATFGRGALQDVIPWLENLSPEELQPAYEAPPALVAILRSTPAAMAGLTQALPEPAWTEVPKPGEWCLTEILCHLRDVEAEVNLPRLQKILSEQNPFLPGMVTDPWAEERLYICQDGPSALADFLDCRLRQLQILERLEAQDWDLPARHAFFGPTKLAELVNINAGHDRLHVRQFHQVLEGLDGSGLIG